MFISFIYRIGNQNKTYFGKYVTEYISDDHNGLDTEVEYELRYALNEYNKMQKLPELDKKIKITIGIISFSSNEYIPTHSTNGEIHCFNFYRTYKNELFVNGKKIENSKI